MKAAEIREDFLQFFQKKGHTRVPSGSLVPANDPTLLFSNAGMVQFKDVFLGKEIVDYSRAVSSQRCVRAGGKHNDLENVGYTARHHTFFEMLGNFSFGDYFKHEAITYAWEFLVQVLQISPEKLWVTVFAEDVDAEKIWLQDIGIDPARFTRIGGKDNFWTMGDIGPCGPCTEIFYDHGESVPGGPPGTHEQEGDRFVEIWNLVFMQYERMQDGTMIPLAKPSVDTGMGLERITAVMQGVHSNYATDLFLNLIQKTSDMTAMRDLSSPSLKVISDHVRSCSFLIADGVLPSNEGRGYVLRRIIRRAVRHGHKLGVREPFFYRLVPSLSEIMGEVYPELIEKQSLIVSILKKEEERFAETLELGLGILNGVLSQLNGKRIPGDTVFKLYDTYGFPVDLVSDIAREQGLELDLPGFDKLMAQQKARARVSGQFNVGENIRLDATDSNVFTGYTVTTDCGVIRRLFVGSKEVQQMEVGDEGVVILDNTPFYAESGGQVGDTGKLSRADNVFIVTDAQKQGEVHQHIGQLQNGCLKVGDTVQAEINAPRRTQIVLNHSATHLLHAALRKLLGEEVQQKGSLVDENHLRFDFSYDKRVTRQRLSQIENMVNQQVRNNFEAKAEVMPKEQAFDRGALALFSEKYREEVRTMTMGDFSMELCGGTHVNRTGDIGLFKIVSESGVAAGVRRIEAVTGEKAWEFIAQQEQCMQQVCDILKLDEINVADRITQILKKNRELEKQINDYQMQIASGVNNSLADQAIEIDGLKVLVARLKDIDRKVLRRLLDQMKNKLGSAAIVLAAVNNNHIELVAGVTNDCIDKLDASNLVNMVAQQVGGKGGGKRPDMAEARGTDFATLDVALASVPEWVRGQIQ